MINYMKVPRAIKLVSVSYPACVTVTGAEALRVSSRITCGQRVVASTADQPQLESYPSGAYVRFQCYGEVFYIGNANYVTQNQVEGLGALFLHLVPRELTYGCMILRFQ